MFSCLLAVASQSDHGVNRKRGPGLDSDFLCAVLAKRAEAVVMDSMVENEPYFRQWIVSIGDGFGDGV